ncbi:hypothetical protein TNCV_329591 [Trichonephila clavipes]|nr:hypothetical protein TNCV_329591 [Trichonephila clavipes]
MVNFRPRTPPPEKFLCAPLTKYVSNMSKIGLKQISQKIAVFNGGLLTSPQVNWADIENWVEFLTKEMPDIKIDDNCLFEVERRLNVYLNSNKLEQLQGRSYRRINDTGPQATGDPTCVNTV